LRLLLISKANKRQIEDAVWDVQAAKVNALIRSVDWKANLNGGVTRPGKKKAAYVLDIVGAHVAGVT
jgi:hypothetical protein